MSRITNLQDRGTYNEDDAVAARDRLFKSLCKDENVPGEVFEDILGVTKDRYLLLNREGKDEVYQKVMS